MFDKKIIETLMKSKNKNVFKLYFNNVYFYLKIKNRNTFIIVNEIVEYDGQEFVNNFNILSLSGYFVDFGNFKEKYNIKNEMPIEFKLGPIDILKQTTTIIGEIK